MNEYQLLLLTALQSPRTHSAVCFARFKECKNVKQQQARAKIYRVEMLNVSFPLSPPIKQIPF